ncbi:MAG: hypothetical protein ACNA78_06155 [Balneolaceae bacterium]
MTPRTQTTWITGGAFTVGFALGIAAGALLGNIPPKPLRNLAIRTRRARHNAKRYFQHPIPDLYRATEGLYLTHDDVRHA